jgi:hypothetical protein
MRAVACAIVEASVLTHVDWGLTPLSSPLRGAVALQQETKVTDSEISK